MITNTPALDYWRATTSRLSTMDETVNEIVPKGMDGENWRFLQYSGKAYGGVHIGSALQAGQPSYIVDISGEAADDLKESLRFSDMKVTRIDLQFTIEKPDWWDTVEFHFEMELGEWPRNIKRDVQSRLNAGNDTIYIGDRTSQRYIRVYVKEVNFVRFECEYKGEASRKVWRTIRNGSRDVIAAILLDEVMSLPASGLTESIKSKLAKMNVPGIHIEVEKTKSTDTTRLRWLASLLPTIAKMMSDHDYGDMVTGWFIDLTSEELNRRYESETKNVFLESQRFAPQDSNV